MGTRRHDGTQRFTAGDDDAAPLSRFLRARMPGSWSQLKALAESGKVTINGRRAGASDPVEPGDEIVVDPSARRQDARGRVTIVHDDAHVVVIDKPAGVMSVPYERGDKGTALDLVREAWRRRGRPVAPLFVVHRLDKDTSGLLVYAKTRLAESALGRLFRAHDVERSYACVAHGDVPSGTLVSTLVPDRGDGLRGSSARGGKRAVTHVRAIRRLRGATLCEVRLETGRTHQIRIHLSEAGHPLVGERVYVRDFVRGGGAPLPSPRLLLHAATLGFRHPVTGAVLRFESPLPADFEEVVASLSLSEKARRTPP